MRRFIILFLSAVVSATPQGYNYNNQPQQLSSAANGYDGNFQSFSPSASSNSNSNFYGAGSSSQQVQQPLLFSHPSSSSNFIQQQLPRQEAIISKRFYLHSAPEENDDEYREKHITIGTPRKNYNVVFIKAPAKSNKKTSLKITPALTEDKTVIYVLSKKTDAADIHAEIQEHPSTTAKPEVFFIKYKTSEEAAHAQEQIQAQYDSLGGSSQISDEGIAPVSSVVGSLGSSSSNVEPNAIQVGNYNQLQSGSNSNNGYLPPNFY